MGANKVLLMVMSLLLSLALAACSGGGNVNESVDRGNDGSSEEHVQDGNDGNDAGNADTETETNPNATPEMEFDLGRSYDYIRILVGHDHPGDNPDNIQRKQNS